MARPTNQAIRFERLQEFNNIGKELGSGNREGLSQIVRDLINRVMRFHELPNLQSNGIETKANSLLNIQQYSSILRSSFSDTRCDHDVFGGNRTFHCCSPHSTLVVAQAEHSVEDASSREHLQRNIFAAGIHAERIQSRTRRINQQDASISNSKFLGRLRFVSQSTKP
jgi:hypothetical protein